MLSDYHIHTPLCRHAEGAPCEYVAAAAARGIPEICFTDHAPAPDGYDPTNRMTLAQFPEYERLVRDVQASPAPLVRFGVEADYYEGCEAFLRPWLRQRDFDFVLGSVHYIRDWCFDDPAFLDRWKDADVTRAWREYFESVGRLAASGLFDVVGHLDLPKKFGFRPPAAAVRHMAGPALDAIAAAGMGIEINTAGLRKPVKEIYPSPLLLGMARERNIPICFGSDAHSPHDVGFAFDEAAALARAAGYTCCLRFHRRQPTYVPLPPGHLILTETP